MTPVTTNQQQQRHSYQSILSKGFKLIKLVSCISSNFVQKPATTIFPRRDDANVYI